MAVLKTMGVLKIVKVLENVEVVQEGERAGRTAIPGEF
jgi:hypothetical protein